MTLGRAFHLSGIFFLTWNIGVSGRGLHGALSSDELSVPVLGGRDTLEYEQEILGRGGASGDTRGSCCI